MYILYCSIFGSPYNPYIYKLYNIYIYIYIVLYFVGWTSITTVPTIFHVHQVTGCPRPPPRNHAPNSPFGPPETVLGDLGSYTSHIFVILGYICNKHIYIHIHICMYIYLCDVYIYIYILYNIWYVCMHMYMNMCMWYVYVQIVYVLL